jgi:hypothetical protein
MSFKAKVHGFFSSLTGFIIRVITGVVVAAIIWYGGGFLIDYVLNFFANANYDTVVAGKFSADTPMGYGIRGAIAVIAFLWIVFRKSK